MFLFLALLAADAAYAQCVSLTTLGSAYTQNFDTLSNTAGSTTNNLTIPGWFMTESGGGARDNEQYAVDTGGSTTGDTYSYGAAGSTERALGQLRSGTLIPLFGACFTNNTGATITNLAIAYNGEEWRLGTAGRTDQMNFEYSLNATDLVTGTWTNVAALNFVTPDTATVGAKNGNAAADRSALSSTISSLSIANGATFWIRWNDTDASGADDGLAVDDFSLTPSAAAAVNLSINDVSLNEGNAGTTSFTFTVSLSAPAGPGGVTFDIATADGTATAPSDYTAKSLTSQTIPAGSSTYSFTVLVNGDTTPETNETFFVNVTNVTGATIIDGQGQGTIVNDDAAPNLTVNDVTLNEGNSGTTTFTFTVSLSAPAPAGGVTFDIATANGTATAPSDYTAKSLTSQMIPAGSSTYTFDVLVNGDTTPETDETFFVNVTNVTNAIVTDGQGQGTIVNDDITKIHDVQGNGAATPIPGATVTVEGVVVANFQGANKLQGFFLEEEDADQDADPNTSEGIFIFCGSCTTPVAEGQRVKATGTVSEFNGMTEITASAAGSVVVTDAGNHLAEVTPAPIVLPVVGDMDAFYEAREGMLVTFVDTLTVADHFELSRFGQIVLTQGGRPYQFTEKNAPSVSGNTAWNDNFARREVILDDDNNDQEHYLNSPDGQQFIFYPQANGGFSVGTQGVDFFRAGDVVNGLTGVLQWSFPGFGASTWRIRPTQAHPVTFTVANPRPATPPAVGGAIKAVGMNLLNYFTTIDTTASNSSGPCGPSGGQDCRGADSVAELNRQRERASIVICTLNADVYAFMELENTTPSDTITDLLGAVNARCGGAHPFAFVNTGGTLGTDAIRVQQIYRTGILSPVGSPLVDLDPIHNRPPTAQTFDVVDATNAAFGKRFTVIANHFKSKGCSGSETGGDVDSGDGQSCWAATRKAQASRLLTWVTGTVIPAAGDPDVLLLGDFNSYAMEDSVTTLVSGGYTDLETHFDANTYSYLFSGQIGHLDYGFASPALLPQITGAAPWHINADEADLFDYNDEVKDAGEATFEEKPDGSALVPPRVVFQPGTPYRASDHDPVLVGLFQVADLAVTITDAPDPVTAGTNLAYTVTVANSGPDAATNATWTDTLPAGTTFVSLPAVAGWSCTTPAVGAGGTVSCSNANFAVGNAVFTLTVAVDPAQADASTLSDTATVSSDTGDPVSANNSATATTTVATSADLSITNTDSPDPIAAGDFLLYTIKVTNSGPSDATSVSVDDTVPANTTYDAISFSGCTVPPIFGTGTVHCPIATIAAGASVTIPIYVRVDRTVAAGTIITDTATVAAVTTDPASGNNSASAATTLITSADLAVTVTDAPDPVTAGGNLVYTITVDNDGPSVAADAALTDTLPPGTTFVSLASPAGWSCTTPAVGSNGTVTCSNASLDTNTFVADSVFTLTVRVDAGTANGTLISDTATVTSATGDPALGNDSATATTTVGTSADIAISVVDSPDPANAGTDLTYTITLSDLGPSNAANPAWADTLPGGTTFASLTAPLGWTCSTPPAGGTGTVSCSSASLAVGNEVFTLVVHTDPTLTAGTVLSNTATATTSSTDGNSGNNSATATTTIATQSDLQVTIADAPDPVTAGTNLTYTITVTHTGASAAANVSLSDPATAGEKFVSLTAPVGWSCTTPAVGTTGNVSCTIASFSGASAVFTLVEQVDPITGAGTLTNTATVTSTTSDPTPADNSATATTTVTTQSDLQVTIADAPDPVTAGQNLTYTITVSHTGASAPANVALADLVAAGETFVSLASPPGWSCTAPAVGTGGGVNCTIASFAGPSAVFTLVVKVDSSLSNGTVTNTATVSSSTSDPTPADNSATATTTTQIAPSSSQVSAIKSVATSGKPGTAVTYTIVLTNNMPHAQGDNPGDEFVDVLPAQLTLVGATASSGTALATTATNTVTWNGAIATGGSVTITIDATLKANASGTVSNQGSVAIDVDGNGSNESTIVTSAPTGPAGSPTTFAVLVAVATTPAPMLSPAMLLALAALIGFAALRKRRAR